ncbi:DNA repair-scaffolding protein [Microtus ochrogaster]|uniref:DNA repair-scaffolding protein n=1 Tax=Microtus ochrogaster TaxID=79684 RepID=A0A8J6KTK2_MICOH|nr:DNA repair-scaffolding protein [Microtus ochrogaster]
MKYWVRNGAASEKLIDGFATYAQIFSLTDPSNNGIGAPTSSPGPEGPYTQESGILAYYEVCTFLTKGATQIWEGSQEVPYAYQRKRNWRIAHPSFLEARPQQSRRANLKTVEAAASLSKAWLKCGEGFQNTSETLSLASEKTTIFENPLELSPSPKKDAADESPGELANITWSSSGSDFSEEDRALPQLQRDGGHGRGADRFCSRTASRPEDGATEDELQLIEWEINSDVEDPGGPSECEDGEGSLDISDCASCASGRSLTKDDRLCEPPELQTSFSCTELTSIHLYFSIPYAALVVSQYRYVEVCD